MSGSLQDSREYAASGGRGGPWRLADPLFGVRCGSETVHLFWWENAVDEARNMARRLGKPGAWITHAHTDRQAFVKVSGKASDDLSGFNPKPTP